MRHRLRDNGFPLLVFTDLFFSAYQGANVQVPATAPDFALQAAAVYRLEVGAACFVVIYLAAMAFFLALDGRGFVEFGTRGLKTAPIIQAADDDEQVTVAEQIEVNQSLENELEDVKSALRSVIDDINGQEDRLLEIEAQTKG